MLKGATSDKGKYLGSRLQRQEVHLRTPPVQVTTVVWHCTAEALEQSQRSSANQLR